MADVKGTSISAQEGTSTAVSKVSNEERVSYTVTPEHGIISRNQATEERIVSAHLFYVFATLVSNQMSQMLLLLPTCVAILGWWRATLATAIFGLLSCWTAQLLQVFCFRFFPTAQGRDEIVQDAHWLCMLKDPSTAFLPKFHITDIQATSHNPLKSVCVFAQNDHQNITRYYTNVDYWTESHALSKWNMLLSDSYDARRMVKKLGMLGMGFNILCLLTRSIIQLTYAVSIVYFVNDKIDKRNLTYAWASCCVLFALVPNLTRYSMFSVLSFVTATVAALIITIASLLHQPSQGVEHTVVSSSITSLAWVSGTIIYAFGDGSVSVETFIDINKQITVRQFKYAFWGSMAYATPLSLVLALSSYWVFGDELAKIPPAARPCTLAVLPPSYWRDMASISLLILQLIGISQSLYPLFMYLRKVLRLLNDRRNECCVLYCMARLSVIGFICILAAAIPFSGSMEITSLVGSLVVSPAIYLIPAAAHILLLTNGGFRGGAHEITSFIINIILFAGVLIFVVIMGGVLTGIEKVFRSHNFHPSDFWNRCYLCADLWLPPAFAPVSAPAPPQFVHCLTNNSSMSNGTC